MADAPVRVLGLWHLALRVRDVSAAAAFYGENFGLHEVWRPDAQVERLAAAVAALPGAPGVADLLQAAVPAP